MSNPRTVLFLALGVVTAWFVAAWYWRVRAARAAGRVVDDPPAGRFHSAVGFVMCFFDTLGIGNFATTTSMFKLRHSVRDEWIPGTLNVAYALPTVAQAFIYIKLVPVDFLTLVTMIGASVLGAWLGLRGVQIADAWPGIVLAQVFVAAPFLIIVAQVAFAAVDPALERVSYALGVPPLRTFFRVSLPLAWPGILAGLPLVWLRALGEFGATVMLAYHPYSLPVYLFVQFGAEGLRAALPIAAMLAVLGVAALGAAHLAGAPGVGRRR